MTVRVASLSRAMMRRSMRLLDMEYKPSEVADELGATKEQVVRLISAGAPARKDAKGHYWIHGETFVKWLEDAAPKNRQAKTTFEENESWCMTCRAKVAYIESRRRGNVSYGKCPNGHKVARFMSKKTTGKAGKKQ